jgi:superfamily II DNA or RNA helicase
MVFRITLDEQFCFIEGYNSFLKEISQKLIKYDMSECWVRGVFHKEKAKPIKFLTIQENSAILPIGLLQDFLDIVNAPDTIYKIIDNRKKDEWNFTDEEIKNCLWTDDNDFYLRDYQIDAVKAMLNNFNGIIKAGTGSGKTEVINAWCKLTNLKTLVLFKEIKLAHQTLIRMKKAGMDAGIVQGSNIDQNHQIVMATVQSGHKLNNLEQFDAITIDECHNANRTQYQEILCSKFKYRWGFSATPFSPKDKLKNFKVKMWLGELIFDIATTDLIDEGYLAKPIITFYEVDKATKNIKKKDGTTIQKELNIFEYKYKSAEQAGIIHNTYRNKLIQAFANILPGTSLVLVRYVDNHGQILADHIENSYFLSGKNKLQERIDITKKLEDNEIKTIVASTIFDEGISIDNVYNVILAGGGVSYIRQLQRIGRGMRLHTDEKGNEKTTVRIIDFYDKTNPILERQSNDRIKFCKSEGYEVHIKKLK